jgi:ankyrin repeat protein
MSNALRIGVAFASLTGVFLCAGDIKRRHPSFDYDIAKTHEIKPHRRTIPMQGITGGFNQFHLKLTISYGGNVEDAEAESDEATMKFWPQLRDEILRWRFVPFEEEGRPTIAEVEEYVDLVPPGRLPTRHITAPTILHNSRIAISLQRSGCFGSCPSYKVTLDGASIVFEGHGFVVAPGRHTSTVTRAEVEELARHLVGGNFYSMDSKYSATVTDNPSYELTVVIDGKAASVLDYVGAWVGMPAVITALEDEVDRVARTDRWIEGDEGLVTALRAEHFDFHSPEAQRILKEAAVRGKIGTVSELLNAGVPLDLVVPPRRDADGDLSPSSQTGLLSSAGGQPDVLKLLISAGASKNDDADKDLALLGAARAGNVEGARDLIAYGANPNADFHAQTVTEESGGMTLGFPGAGSVLIYAAESGNPDMVREILRYHPKLEARDNQGKTAIFAAADFRYKDKDGSRVECVRLLGEAGADVNARDHEGNTPLHETFLTDVEEELLKLGADVNARNDDGETPIFTTVDNDAIPLLIRYGADLSIRNNNGQTVVEAAGRHGPLRVEALQKTIQSSTSKQ